MLSHIINYKFNHFNQIILFVFLNSLYPAVARPIEQPIIASSVTDCKTAYLIQIFKDGSVEYRGRYGVKAIGRNRTHINQQTLNALLKKFEDADFVEEANRLAKLPVKHHRYGIREAIQLHQEEVNAIVFNTDIYYDKNPLLGMLRFDIIHATKAEQWVGRDSSLSACQGKLILIENIKNH